MIPPGHETMDPLDILVRLAEQEVERARRALAEFDQRIAQLTDRIECERAGLERALGDPAPGPLLAAFVEASRERIRKDREQLADLEIGRRQKAARLLDHRIELKRLELLRDRRRVQEQIEAERREQKEVDEQAVLQAARRTDG